jgi:DNA-binding HxlR family transcriptional regulator
VILAEVLDALSEPMTVRELAAQIALHTDEPWVEHDELRRQLRALERTGQVTRAILPGHPSHLWWRLA